MWQAAQLRVRVPTAEQDAAAVSRYEGGEEGERRQQLEIDEEGAGDTGAEGSSSAILTTAKVDNSGDEVVKRQKGHLCYKCGSNGEAIQFYPVILVCAVAEDGWLLFCTILHCCCTYKF